MSPPWASEHRQRPSTPCCEVVGFRLKPPAPPPTPHFLSAAADVWLRHAAARSNVQQQFLELPHGLRQEVAWELNRALLTRLPLFR